MLEGPPKLGAYVACVRPLGEAKSSLGSFGFRGKNKSMAMAVGNDTNLIGAVAITHGDREIGSTGTPVMPEIGERFFFDIRGLPHGVLAKLFFSERTRLVGVAFGSRCIGTTRRW